MFDNTKSFSLERTIKEFRICVTSLYAASLLIGFFLMVFGSQLTLMERYCVAVPYCDDWKLWDFLEKSSSKEINWSFIFENHNQNHLHLTTKLTSLMAVLTNGLYDRKQEGIIRSFFFALVAVSVLIYYAKYIRLAPYYFLIFPLILFLLPFSGYRAAWPFLIAFDTCVLFTLMAFFITANYFKSNWALLFSLVFSTLAAFSIGSGSLVFAAIIGLVLFQIFFKKHFEKISIFWIGLHAIFLVFFLSKIFSSSTSNSNISIFWGFTAFFKALGWPWVFTSWGALFAIIPLVLFLKKIIQKKEELSVTEKSLFLVWTWILLQCLAIGFMRGENNNSGIPSGRYTSVVMQVFFVELASWIYLIKIKDFSPKFIFKIWIIMMSIGLMIHFNWRIWPFLANENGEFFGNYQQQSLREYFQGNTQKFNEIKNAEATGLLESGFVF